MLVFSALDRTESKEKQKERTEKKKNERWKKKIRKEYQIFFSDGRKRKKIRKKYFNSLGTVWLNW